MKRALPLGGAGVCLIEAMIAMAAGVVVLSASIQALKHFDRRLGTQQESMAQSQDLRLGLKVLQEELHLAGTGSGVSGTAVVKADAGEIVFFANLASLSTSLTQPIVSGQQQLSVKDGSGWPKNKRILVCSEDRCVESRLARDGQAKTLSLTDPLGQAFPVGSTVSISNQVRYYLGKDARGKTALMRQVDGGANPLVSDIAWFRMRYLDRDGHPTQDAGRVIRMQVELAIGDGRHRIKSEIGMRAT